MQQGTKGIHILGKYITTVCAGVFDKNISNKGQKGKPCVLC